MNPKPATTMAYRRMPGIITRRVPKRSRHQPSTGQAIAVQMAARNTALERSPRVMPSSAETGFRKTPDEKIRIGRSRPTGRTPTRPPPASGWQREFSDDLLLSDVLSVVDLFVVAQIPTIGTTSAGGVFQRLCGRPSAIRRSSRARIAATG